MTMYLMLFFRASFHREVMFCRNFLMPIILVVMLREVTTKVYTFLKEM